MKKKLLVALLAAVLGTPQVAFAARDGEGMEYTSASEGFYGSIRTVYRSKAGAEKDNGGVIEADGSRLGVRGTLDLGSGLTGLYRYEWSIRGNNGDEVGTTRLSYVGLRGGFGEFVAGSHWENDYNWVTAGTDIASSGSGNFAPHFRRANSFQYTTPDIEGFQGSFRFTSDGNNKQNGGEVSVPNLTAMVESNTATLTGGTLETPSENVDEWAIAGKYSTHGFTFGGAYEVRPDDLRGVNFNGNGTTFTAEPSGSNDEDDTFWALRAGYGQDNWAVNAWYGEHNDSDRNVVAVNIGGTPNAAARSAVQSALNDTKIFSLSGNIDLGKFAVVGLFEQRDDILAREDSVFLFNVDYKFTSRSKAYLVYIANDFDSDPNKEDEIRLGLRMDF